MESFASKVLEYINKSKTLTMNLPLIEGKTFTNETIFLDFTHYQNCTFKNCTIIIEYGLLRLNENGFHTCKFEAPTGTPAHAILTLNKLLQDSFTPDEKDSSVLEDHR